MLLELSSLHVILINIAVWLAVHLSVPYGMTRVPLGSFDDAVWLYRRRGWERDGRLYERVFGVRRWKGRLPDGAVVFKRGFAKKCLKGVDNGYLESFVRETCRAELVHWTIMVFAPLFFVWNPWWAGVVMVAYALAANLPCIITQRYNRARLRRVLGRRTGMPAEATA